MMYVQLPNGQRGWVQPIGLPIQQAVNVPNIPMNYNQQASAPDIPDDNEGVQATYQ